jgi:hypothetical protein
VTEGRHFMFNAQYGADQHLIRMQDEISGEILVHK